MAWLDIVLLVILLLGSNSWSGQGLCEAGGRIGYTSVGCLGSFLPFYVVGDLFHLQALYTTPAWVLWGISFLALLLFGSLALLFLAQAKCR